MKMFIFGTVAVLALVGGWLAYLALGEAIDSERASQALVAPRGADAGAQQSSNDDDAGTDAVETQLWTVSFGDGPADAWIEGAVIQLDGKDMHAFRRDDFDTLLVVTVMTPETDDPATELIEKTWDEVQQEPGMTAGAIEMISYGTHTWVGYQFQGTFDGAAKTGMAYASIDTTERGAKVVMVAMWPTLQNEHGSRLFHEALEQVVIQRQ